MSEEAPRYEGGSSTSSGATATLDAPPRVWTARPIERRHLLDDKQIANFICDGYFLIQPEHRAGLNEEIDEVLNRMERNPGDGILDAVPQLWEVWNNPTVRGGLASILGHDVTMSSHRHWHDRRPGPWSQGWHQDSTNVRHHKTMVCLGLYYPHDVTIEMGPTVIMPGTHFRNAPTDRMATYGNLRGQVPIIVKAGTVAITHYDIWHGGSINRSNRTRHMLKFLFNRGKAPTAPEWNHDPAAAKSIAGERFGQWPPFCGQSDHYKQIQLRWSCWKHMCGVAAPVAE